MARNSLFWLAIVGLFCYSLVNEEEGKKPATDRRDNEQEEEAAGLWEMVANPNYWAGRHHMEEGLRQSRVSLRLLSSLRPEHR